MTEENASADPTLGPNALPAELSNSGYMVKSQSSQAAPGCDRDCVEISVNGIGGSLCKVNVALHWTVHQAKAAVEAKLPQIPAVRQRLLVGDVELRDDKVLLSSVLSPGEVAEVTLVQRTPQQADWIQQAGTEFTQLLVNSEAWSDRDTVLAAVRLCGSSLQHASPDLRGNREIVAAAVTENGLALQYASPTLAADPEIVLEAVRRCGRALEFAAPDLRAADDFAALAVQQNWRALEHCNDVQRANREIVLSAIAQSGRALGCASAELRDDFEVATAAVQQDPAALSFASASLRADPELRTLAQESRRFQGRVKLKRAMTC